MVCIGEYVRTYDGYEGVTIKKIRVNSKDVDVHIRDKKGNVCVYSEKMVQESLQNPSCEISIIRNLIDELEVLRKESIEHVDLISQLVEENNTYKGYLFENRLN